MLKGRIHSVESMGLVDGPGIRSVVFFQGCRLRCQYCHNPDTWHIDNAAKEVTSDELVKQLLRFREYYGEDGGVTLSGGEPLLQLDFAIEVFTLLKAEGIHTCLDTAGVGDEHEPAYVDKLKKLLSLTDLVLLDIKHEDPLCYKKITGHTSTAFERFLAIIQQRNNPLWIRHVVVPGLTDSEEHIRHLKAYIAKLKHVEKVELLPYHAMGETKYETLGIPYSLHGIPSLTHTDMKPYEKMLQE